jgi:hypothetical protein
MGPHSTALPGAPSQWRHRYCDRSRSALRSSGHRCFTPSRSGRRTKRSTPKHDRWGCLSRNPTEAKWSEIELSAWCRLNSVFSSFPFQSRRAASGPTWARANVWLPVSAPESRLAESPQVSHSDAEPCEYRASAICYDLSLAQSMPSGLHSRLPIQHQPWHRRRRCTSICQFLLSSCRVHHRFAICFKGLCPETY